MTGQRAKGTTLLAPSVGQCVWVDAGVISYRLCPLNYQCERCSLHHALVDGPGLLEPRPLSSSSDRAEIEKRRRDAFEAFFNKLPASARKCRHMLTGEISYKLCVNAFRCASCSFAQMLDDSAPPEDVASANESHAIGGLGFPCSLHYHRSHTWIRVEQNGDVRVGLDDLGQRLLGDLRRVHAPEIGDTVFEGVEACRLDLETVQIGILAPISGTVLARNERLVNQPTLVNQSPYTDGWLFKLKPSDLSFELASLLYGSEARRWLELEVARAEERTTASRTSSREGVTHGIASEFLLAPIKKAA